MQKRFVWIEIEKSGWTLYVSTYYLPSSFFPGVLDFCCSQWVPTKFLLCSHQVPNGFPPSPYYVPIKFPMGSQHNPQVFHVFLNMFLIAPHLITHALLNIAPFGTCKGRWAHIENDLCLWRKVICFVLQLWDPLNWDVLDCVVLCVFGKLLTRRGAWAWFHDVWTCGAKVLEYWMKFSSKIKVNPN
jgi:hypothetical protein